MESSTNSNLYTKSSSTSSTEEQKIPGSTQNMYGTGSNKSFEETNLEQVPNIRGNGDTDFSEKKNDGNYDETAYVTYAVEDVENIDNVDFDYTDNSLLDDDEEVQVWNE